MFVFDVDYINIGGYYSYYIGVFICFSYGVYVFFWSIYCYGGGYVYLEFVVNLFLVFGKFVGVGSVINILFLMDLVIVELNVGDEVYI